MTSRAKSNAGQGRKPAGRADRLHVVPQGGGWAVKRAGQTQSIGLYRTQEEATRAAQDALRASGGELRIQGRDGRWRESFTLGRNAMASISAVEGVHLTADMQRDFRDFDHRGLSAGKRRRAIAGKYGKGSA
jgi:hypothetical protein